jgi:hypothetical protein
MTVRKMTVKKNYCVRKNDGFNETTIVKYNRRKNVYMKKKSFKN